jgi:hypothetical protein
MRLGRFDAAVPVLGEAAAERGGSRAAEAGYDLGCVLYRLREPDRATGAWRDVLQRHPDSPSAARARARLRWPEAVAMYESLTAPALPAERPGRTHTEVDRSGDEGKAIRDGIDYLLSQQYPDGTWTTASNANTYRVAITAIVARSLHLWGTKREGDQRDRIRMATERATAWLNRQVKQADPEMMDSFGAAYLLDYFLDLEETKAAVKGDVKGAIELLLGRQCPNGAWSYGRYWGMDFAKRRKEQRLEPARTHSVNTGLALLPLGRAKRLGFRVDAKALEEGRKALLAMRDKPGVYTYIYPGPKNFNGPDASSARGPLCEHALCLLGAVSNEDLGAAIELFLKYREDLRPPVKVWGPSWLPPHGYTSYFFFFGYDHAAQAITFHGGRDAAKRLDKLREDLLRMAEVDGTWLDYEPIGKPYGTAMALHVLYLARQAKE